MSPSRDSSATTAAAPAGAVAAYAHQSRLAVMSKLRESAKESSAATAAALARRNGKQPQASRSAEAAPSTAHGGGGRAAAAALLGPQVVVHIDLDCFFASSVRSTTRAWFCLALLCLQKKNKKKLKMKVACWKDTVHQTKP